MEVISERLGHTTPALTLSVYRHLLKEERRVYAPSLSEMLSGQKRPKA